MKEDYAHSSHFLSVHDLSRQAGATHHYELSFILNEDLGDAVQHVTKNNQVKLDVTLHSVLDGIYLDGKIYADVDTVCAKCGQKSIDLWECEVNAFFFYKEKQQEDDNATAEIYPLIDGLYIDLLQLSRDTFSDRFSFAPVCQKECQEVKTTFDDGNDKIDPRLSALQNLRNLQ